MADEEDAAWTTLASRPQGRKAPKPRPLVKARPPIDATNTIDSSLPPFERLPAEVRGQIFRKVLTFEQSLHHRKRLLPFFFAKKSEVKREAVKKEPVNLIPGIWKPCSHEPVSIGEHSGLSVLRLNKRLFNEAIKVFYEMNTVQIPAALVCIKRVRELWVGDSDLSLAYNLTVVASKSCWKDYETAPMTTIRSLHLRFPNLRSVTVEVEAQKINLVDLYIGFKNMGTMQNIRFEAVGRFEAVSQHGFTCSVQVADVVRLWSTLSNSDSCADNGGMVSALAGLDDLKRLSVRTRRLFNTVEILERGKRKTQAQNRTWREAKNALQEQLRTFRDRFERTSFRQCGLESVEFRTWYITS